MAQDQITTPISPPEPNFVAPTKEAGPVVDVPVQSAEISEFVQRIPVQPEIPDDVAVAGVIDGEDKLNFSQTALQGVGATRSVNPSLSAFKGLTLVMPEAKATKLVEKGDPQEGETGEAEVEVKQIKRWRWMEELANLLPKAA